MAAFPVLKRYLFLQHFDAIDVNIVAVYFPAHSNMMSVMPFKGIWIIHGQNFLISIGDNDRAGSGLNALLGACSTTCAGILAPALGIADPAVDGTRILGKRYRSGRHDHRTGK